MLQQSLGFWDVFKYRKPVIFYAGRLHYVERNPAEEIQEARRYALFRVYYLKGTLSQLRKEIILALGLSTKISFSNGSTYVRRPIDSSTDNDVGIAKPDIVKIQISFKHLSHLTLINRLRNSKLISKITQNGFLDWIPLDRSSYNALKTTWNLIVVSQDPYPSRNVIVKQKRLLAGIYDLSHQKRAYQGLAELFHGQVYKVVREGTGEEIVVVETKTYSANIVFIEILNWIFEYVTLNQNVDTPFISLLVSALNMYATLFCLNDIYQNLAAHGWGSYGTNKKGDNANTILARRLISLEDVLTEIQWDNFTSQTKKLREAIERISCLFQKDGKDLEIRTRVYVLKRLRFLVGFFIIIAIYSIVIFYHYWNLQDNLLSMSEMVLLATIVSISTLMFLYIRRGIKNYARFSAWFMKAASLHRDTVKEIFWEFGDNLNKTSQEGILQQSKNIAASGKESHMSNSIGEFGDNSREEVLRHVMNCTIDVCGDLRDTIIMFGES
ncbi:hypothetical protein G9A89_010468 [Geosiphon pyriformis]|nr:hypothetical protein G9A89_010468 [Geosiphon pyriformis]